MKIRLSSSATVIACVALLVALSGTAVAGVLITGSQIKTTPSRRSTSRTARYS